MTVFRLFRHAKKEYFRCPGECFHSILIMCRSGSRAAVAVNRLAEKGFKDVYNITDGFEGDKVKDKQSVYKGKRLRNGWKNATINWTYDLNPELVYKY